MREFELEKLSFMASLHYACYGSARYMEGGVAGLSEERHLDNARFLVRFVKNSTVEGRQLPESYIRQLDTLEDRLVKAFRADLLDAVAIGDDVSEDILLKELVKKSKFSSLKKLRKCTELNKLTRLVVDQHLG
ncbi:hypothetical protein NBRC116587_33240 [Pseudoteredinibacter isoporae]